MPVFDPPDKLETYYQEPYQAWKSKPSPNTTGNLLRAAKKDIEKGISLHVGRPNPLIRSQAKRIAIQAFESYDPTKNVKLSTHLINNLQGLKRITRKQTQILKVPERVSMDQNRVRLAEQELLDDTGREPSMQELADYTGLSTKRLQYLQNFKPAISEGSLEQEGEDNQEFAPAIKSINDRDPWLDIVYGDLDPVNQKIMEWTLGLNGQPVLQNQQIADRLRITAGAVSQRKNKIQSLLDMGAERSPF